MHVVIDARRYESGMWVYLSSLIEALQRIDHGHRFTLIVHRGRADALPLADPRFSQRLTSVTIENHVVGEPWRNIYLPYLLRKLRADVFHDPGYFAPLFPSRAKRVVTFHDMVPFVHKRTNSRKYFFYMRTMMRMTARVADHIIADSAHTKQDIIKTLGIDPGRISVIHLAARPAFRRLPPGPEGQAILDRLSIRQPYILNVGTVEPRKNISRLLEAFSALKRSGRIPHQLVICGALGWLYQPVFQAIRDLALEQDVVMTQFLPDAELNWLYNLADVFVFPSLYEGFGLPPLEALACGAPVAASRTSCIPEILGDAAVYFQPTDVESIAETLAGLIANPEQKRRLSALGVARAAQFTWERTARQTLRVYEALTE